MGLAWDGVGLATGVSVTDEERAHRLLHSETYEPGGGGEDQAGKPSAGNPHAGFDVAWPSPRGRGHSRPAVLRSARRPICQKRPKSRQQRTRDMPFHGISFSKTSCAHPERHQQGLEEFRQFVTPPDRSSSMRRETSRMGVRRRYLDVTRVRVRGRFGRRNPERTRKPGRLPHRVQVLAGGGLPGNCGRDGALCGIRERTVQKKSLPVA